MDQVVHEGRVVRFDEWVEWCLLPLMALVDGMVKCMPINGDRVSTFKKILNMVFLVV